MILVGKSLGKPNFGCPFCSASTPYLTDGELYCLEDLLELHKVAKITVKQKLIIFCSTLELCWGRISEKNSEKISKCDKPPLAGRRWTPKGVGATCCTRTASSFGYRNASYLSSALDLIFTGVVDKLLTEFENRVFLTKKAGRKWMDNYLKKVLYLLIYLM